MTLWDPVFHLDFQGLPEGQPPNASSRIHALGGAPVVHRDEPLGPVLVFDGKRDFLDLGPLTIDFSKGMSLMARVRYERFQHWSRIADFGNGPRKDNIILANVGSSRDLGLYIFKGNYRHELRIAKVLETAVWMHLAVTIDADGQAMLYKNGQALLDEPVAMPLPNSVTRTCHYLGKSQWGQDRLFSGKIGHFSLFNRGLSRDEVLRDTVYHQVTQPIFLNGRLPQAHTRGGEIFRFRRDDRGIIQWARQNEDHLTTSDPEEIRVDTRQTASADHETPVEPDWTALTFVPVTEPERFAPVHVPAGAGGGGIWHIFVHDPALKQVVAYSVRCDQDLGFDLGDREGENHSGAGLQRRVLILKDLEPSGGPMTRRVALADGSHRVLLALPVRSTRPAGALGQTALISFGLDARGYLSRVNHRMASRQTFTEFIEETVGGVDPLAGMETITLANAGGREGLFFDGDLHFQSPSLPPASAGEDGVFARSLAAWILPSQNGAGQQHILGDVEGSLNLAIDPAGHMNMNAAFSDGGTESVRDPEPLIPGKWVHYTGVFDHQGHATYLLLMKNGFPIQRGEPNPADRKIPVPFPAHLSGDIFHFDGKRDRVTLPAHATPTRALTVMLWARSATPAWNATGCLLSKRNAFVLHPNQGTRAVCFFVFNEGWGGPSTTVEEIQNWHHYAGSFDGQNVRLYVDGELRAVSDFPGTIAEEAGKPITIASDLKAEQRFFAGDLADVRIYDQALTAPQLNRVRFRALTGNDPAPVGWWPLMDGDLSDRAAGGRHGELSGAPTSERHETRLPNLGSGEAVYQIGGDFCGCLADVQVWNTNPDEHDVEWWDLAPNSGFRDLAARWMLADSEGGPAPDCSGHQRHAIPHGAPHGEPPILGYANRSLLPVDPGMLRETRLDFRFRDKRETCPADGVFAFAPRWQIRRGKWLPLSEDNVLDTSFESLGDGWIRASQRFRVPSDAAGIQALELVLQDWLRAGLEFRDVQLGHLGDHFTRVTETEVIDLTSLSTDPDAEDRSEVRDREADTAVLADRARVWAEWVAAKKNRAHFTAQKRCLMDLIRRLELMLDPVPSVDRPPDGPCRIKSCHGYGEACPTPVLQPAATEDGQTVTCAWRDVEGRIRDEQFWVLLPNSEGYFHIRHECDGRYLNLVSNGQGRAPIAALTGGDATPTPWRIKATGAGRFTVSTPGSDRNPQLYLSIQPGDVTQSVIALADNGRAEQRWVFEAGFLHRHRERLERRVILLKSRLAIVQGILAMGMGLDIRRRRRDQTLTRLEDACEALARHQKTGPGQNNPIRLPLLAGGPGGSTHGVLLEDVGPVTGFSTRDEGAGRVWLECREADGDLRPLHLDLNDHTLIAEQKGVRLTCNRTGDHVMLQRSIPLPPNEWRFECCFVYPGAYLQEHEFQVFAGSRGGEDAPFALRGGTRPGFLVGGFFQECGPPLDRVLDHGWHRARVVAQEGTTRLFLDGRELPGEPCIQRKYLHFNKPEDAVVMEMAGQPIKAVTVAFWVRAHNPSEGAVVFSLGANPDQPAVALLGGRHLSVVLNGNTLQTECNPSTRWWRHLALTWVSRTGTLVLYVDGLPVFCENNQFKAGAIGGGGSLVLAQSLAAAAGEFPPETAFEGDIGGFSFWNRARTGAEIFSDRYRHFPADEVGLIFYWDMETRRVGETFHLLNEREEPGATLLGSPKPKLLTLQCRSNITYLGNSEQGDCPAGDLAEVKLWLGAGTEPTHHWSMNDTDFAAVRDHSSTHNHGTVRGAARLPATHSDHPGTAVMGFSRPGGINCGDVPHLIETSFTVEFWVKRRVLGGGQFCLVLGEAANNRGLHIGFSRDNRFHFGFYGNDLNTADPITDHHWHHWAAIYDHEAGKRTLLRDGVKVAAGPCGQPFTGQGPLTLGRTSWSGRPNWFEGCLAEVRLWDHARTRAKVQPLMYRRLSGSEPGLIGYWPLDRFAWHEEDVVTPNLAAPNRSESGEGSLNQQRTPIEASTRFDGIKDEVVLPEMDVDWSAGLTIEVWVKYQDFQAWTRILDLGPSSRKNSDNICLGNSGSPRRIALRIFQGGRDHNLEVDSARLEAEEWTHVAAVLDARGNGAIFINGQPAATGNLPLPVNKLRKFNRIASNLANKKSLAASVTELRLWNRPRAVEEIRADLYYRLAGSETGLVGYWPLGEYGARDLSPHGRHGTPAGDPALSTSSPQLPDTGPGAGTLRARAVCSGTNLFISTDFPILEDPDDNTPG